MSYRLENVAKTYSRHGQTLTAFATSALEIAAREYVAIVGPSGSGKTTLLSMLGGMLSPTAGRVWLDGVSLYDLNLVERARKRRELIGFVFQTFNLIPYLTAIENVQMPLYLANLSREAQRDRAAKLLEQVGLADRLGHKPPELSIGQQQRVALARTLAADPPIILADEPTGNLDIESRGRVLDFLDTLHAQGRTIVMVTHDTAAAERASRRVIITGGAILDGLAAPKIRAA